MIKQANTIILWPYQEWIKDGNETLRDTNRETKYNEKGGSDLSDLHLSSE